MKDILKLTSAEKREFLDSFDIVLSDCDGVIWTVLSPIPDTGEAINLLKNSGKRFTFVSNNSMRSNAEYIEKLKSLGIKNPDIDDVVHPVNTIARHFKEINFQGAVYTIAAPIFAQTLREHGFDVIEGPEMIFSSQPEFAASLSLSDPVRAVIVDIDINVSFAKLVRAQHFLKHPDCILIVGASDKLIPLKKDFNILGSYYFYAMLSDVSGKEPIVLGKPGKLLGEFLKSHFNIKDPKRALFIGDALLQDIGFGRSCGFQTMAVLTGATSRTDLFNHKIENEIPDYYANSLADFIEFFKDIQ